MIVKIPKARGSKSIGLMRYLFGPGYKGEHEDPHIITAAESLGVADGTRFENMREVIALGHQIDAPGQLFGVEVKGGNIWHVSLSNAAGDRLLSDEEWAEISHKTMVGMGFEAEGKAPVRWAAVRHGLSAGGFDHIHIVVDLVREDGTKASIWKDRVTMSRLAAQFEREYGLAAVGGRAGAGLEGNARAELQRAEKEAKADPRRAEPVRERLAREVRAAATASASEAEFVRRLREGEVLVRPRYAKGGRGEVVGYSVALRPVKGADKRKVIWYGGGRLAPDLTLPRLRAAWEATPAARAEALAAWRGRSAAGREARELTAAAWEQAAEQVRQTTRALALIPYDDRAAWSGAAQQAAGVYAALSKQLETRKPGPLAAAARALAYSAQNEPGRPKAQRTPATASLRGVSMVVQQAGQAGRRRSVEQELMLIRSMVRMVRMLGAADEAQGKAARARMLLDNAREQMETVHRVLTLAPAGEAAGLGAEAGQTAPAHRPHSYTQINQKPESRLDR
jgi:hypothetical protein